MTTARALLLAVAVGTAAALGIAWDYDDIPEEKIERIQDAAAYFRAKGVTDEQMATRLASHTSITYEKALEIVRRSYGRDLRDTRSLRTIEIHMWTNLTNLTTAETAAATAWCKPLEGLLEHANCLTEQSGWFAGHVCNSKNEVRGRWASLRVRPAEGRRLAAASDPTTGYDGKAMTRGEFEAALASRGLHICQPAS